MDGENNRSVQPGTGPKEIIAGAECVAVIFGASKLFELSANTGIFAGLRLWAAFSGMFLLVPVWAMMCHMWLTGNRMLCSACAILGVASSLIPAPKIPLVVFTLAAVAVPPVIYTLFLNGKMTRFQRQCAISVAAGAVVAGGLVWLIISGYGSAENLSALMTEKIESFLKMYVVDALNAIQVALSEDFSVGLTKLILMRIPELAIYTAVFLGWMTEVALKIISNRTGKQVIRDVEVLPTSVPVSFAFYHAAAFLLWIIMMTNTGVGLAVALAMSAVSVMPFAVLGKRVIIKRLKEGPRTMVIVGLAVTAAVLGVLYLILAVSLAGAVWRIRYYMANERKPKQTD